MVQPDDLADYPVPLLVDLANRVLPDVIDRALAEAGYDDVTRAHGHVFDALDPDGSRITDMAVRARITKQAMGELCTSLEQRGYLARIPDPADGRAKLVVLTARGAAMVAVARTAMADLDAAWTAHLGRDATRDLRAALTSLVVAFAADHVR
ncbi:MarR family winged helix-turn-helix transcriptional regulator [Pseudonocardia sp.]|uniref:MarR family winged helix-turn-helix transcriptional regulator n=1 Tax=Pseudonocardia sp. TaxID=60912 RepID=UPI003D0FBBFA